MPHSQMQHAPGIYATAVSVSLRSTRLIRIFGALAKWLAQSISSVNENEFLSSASRRRIPTTAEKAFFFSCQSITDTPTDVFHVCAPTREKVKGLKKAKILRRIDNAAPPELRHVKITVRTSHSCSICRVDVIGRNARVFLP